MINKGPVENFTLSSWVIIFRRLVASINGTSEQYRRKVMVPWFLQYRVFSHSSDNMVQTPAIGLNLELLVTGHCASDSISVKSDIRGCRHD